MDNKTWLQLLLFLLGLVLIAFTIYAVRSLPDIHSYEHDKAKQPDLFNKLFRSKRWTEDDECLWMLVAKESPRTLSSPNYPQNYPSNADCQWLVTTREGQENATISIKIDTLAIESEKECRLDYLQVYLGPSVLSPSLGPFCGHIKDRVIKTNSSTLLLVFHSDVAYEETGFSIDYYAQSEPMPECRGLLTDGSGSLTSPRFPENYPDDVDCSTLIRVDEGKKIVLIFDSVDLEYGDNCTFDYVEVYDGYSRNSTLLGQICQLTDTGSVESTSNTLLVHFHSDASVNRKGYRARYSSLDITNTPFGNCLWESSPTNGTITSPNYPENYPSYSNCSLWIVAPQGQQILVQFDALLLEMESNCSYDFLEIREGHSSVSGGKVLGRFCGRRSEPRRLMSSGHEMHIRFQSDDFVEFLGFKLRYEFFQVETDENEESREEEQPFKFRVKPRNATLPPGSSHTLECSTDHPNAKIRWLKGGIFLAGENPLPSLKLLSNNSLWIQSMEPHLAGLYSCVAVSPEGTINTTANVLLGTKKDDLCKLEFRKKPTDAEFEEGAFVHLECLSTQPEALMSWTKDGNPLQPTDRVTVLKNGYVFMDSVQFEDAGIYTCTAEDTETGCIKRTSARLKISRRTRIEDICGKPKFEEAAENVPQKKHGKILGGYDAKKGAYPWQVMLWEPKRQSFCGATLLNERWIVTAAHCLVNHHGISWESIRIKIGKHDRERSEEQELETSISDSSSVVLHPGFNRFTFDNDLALIRMRDRILFTDYILPVCLGDRNLSESLLTGDSSEPPRIGTVIGWGRLKEKGPSPRFLQEIKLPVVDPAICRESTTLTVTRNMFCAGYAQEVIGDTCQGDSGGPFMMKHAGRWYMVGVVSWGEGCGRVDKYGFYTRIANHLSWIRGIMRS